jgi:hypothetical protein
MTHAFRRAGASLAVVVVLALQGCVECALGVTSGASAGLALPVGVQTVSVSACRNGSCAQFASVLGGNSSPTDPLRSPTASWQPLQDGSSLLVVRWQFPGSATDGDRYQVTITAADGTALASLDERVRYVCSETCASRYDACHATVGISP